MTEADTKSLIHNYIKANLKIKQRMEVFEAEFGTHFETHIDLILNNEIISSELTDKSFSRGYNFEDYEK